MAASDGTFDAIIEQFEASHPPTTYEPNHWGSAGVCFGCQWKADCPMVMLAARNMSVLERCGIGRFALDRGNPMVWNEEVGQHFAYD